MSLIDSVAVPITLKRHSAGSFVGGRWQDGAGDPQPIPMSAAVQPARPTELMNFPEGQRTRGAIKLYSETELLTVDEATGRRADVVVYNGREWEVKETGKYEGFGLLAYKAIAVRRDVGTGG